MINNLKKLTDEKIKEFEEKFKCIQGDCAGGGYTIEEEQCQFCAEYLFPIKSFISQTIQDTADVVKRDIKNNVECVSFSQEPNFICNKILQISEMKATVKEPDTFYCKECYQKGLDMENEAMGL